MFAVAQSIRARRSVRTFDARPICPAHLQALQACMAHLPNSYGIDIDCRLLETRTHGLSSPVLVGEDLYIGAKVHHLAHADEAFGYALEYLMLYAQSLGIGTVWLGGTMDRAAFTRAMAPAADERIPCVTPIGYPAAKMSLRESTMRKTIRADERMAFEQLFFRGDFTTPLTPDAAGALALPLEMVRLGPSAVNKQPWRAVVQGKQVHFYLQRTRGFTPAPHGDMQLVDMGIALCHFDLTARECGLTPVFSLQNPALDTALEYIATYTL